MTLLRTFAIAPFVLALVACNEPDPTARTEEGVYGSSSGPNPNLADLQQAPVDPAAPAPADPATAAENTYPSQTGIFSEPSTGAEGGRSSAETGASDN
ncbi:MAG: hypothetical protein AB7H66_03950 [Hyphomonadaceae bacterium]